VGCPLQPDLVNTSCSASCAPDAVLACGRAVHLTHELATPPFCLYPSCPPTSISIRFSLEMCDSYIASPRYEAFIFWVKSSQSHGAALNPEDLTAQTPSDPLRLRWRVPLRHLTPTAGVLRRPDRACGADVQWVRTAGRAGAIL